MFEREARLDELKNSSEAIKEAIDEEFQAPIGLSWFFSLFKGMKLNIKRIHFRYEDDTMARRPISLGLMIDEIELTNAESHWVF